MSEPILECGSMNNAFVDTSVHCHTSCNGGGSFCNVNDLYCRETSVVSIDDALQAFSCFALLSRDPKHINFPHQIYRKYYLRLLHSGNKSGTMRKDHDSFPAPWPCRPASE